jgi:hypothetical protein
VGLLWPSSSSSSSSSSGSSSDSSAAPKGFEGLLLRPSILGPLPPAKLPSDEPGLLAANGLPNTLPVFAALPNTDLLEPMPNTDEPEPLPNADPADAPNALGCIGAKGSLCAPNADVPDEANADLVAGAPNGEGPPGAPNGEAEAPASFPNPDEANLLSDV